MEFPIFSEYIKLKCENRSIQNCLNREVSDGLSELDCYKIDFRERKSSEILWGLTGTL